MDFAGKIESGLFKMMAIGLGKFAGAQRYHTYAYRLGLEKVIRTVGRQVWRLARYWVDWPSWKTPITIQPRSPRFPWIAWSSRKKNCWR